MSQTKATQSIQTDVTNCAIIVADHWFQYEVIRMSRTCDAHCIGDRLKRVQCILLRISDFNYNITPPGFSVLWWRIKFTNPFSRISVRRRSSVSLSSFVSVVRRRRMLSLKILYHLLPVDDLLPQRYYCDMVWCSWSRCTQAEKTYMVYRLG